MDIKEIKELMQTFSENRLTELELTDEGFCLKLKREETVVQSSVTTQPMVQSMPVAVPGAEASLQSEPEDESLVYIESPIIGTFYRSPNPEADPYVSVGDTIRKGQVLCIIEAMKIMNEIEAEIEGTIVKVLPKNTEAVEFGQRLFAVRPL